MVADDDFDMLTTVADALEEWGAEEVVRAASGAELVLHLAEHGPFDLVITDVAMPWMSGLQAMRSVRYAGVMAPIIFITGLEDAQLPDRVAGLGGCAVLLRKPFGLAELEDAVGELLGEARVRR